MKLSCNSGNSLIGMFLFHQFNHSRLYGGVVISCFNKTVLSVQNVLVRSFIHTHRINPNNCILMNKGGSGNIPKPPCLLSYALCQIKHEHRLYS